MAIAKKGAVALISLFFLSAGIVAQEFVHPVKDPPGNKKNYEFEYSTNNGESYPVRVEKKGPNNTWIPLTEASNPATVDEWKWSRTANKFTITFGENPPQGGTYRIVSDRNDGTPTPTIDTEKWK